MRFLWWCKYMLLPGDISLGAEQFGQQDGTARRAIRVTYTTRRTGDPIQPLELTYTDDGTPFDVK